MRDEDVMLFRKNIFSNKTKEVPNLMIVEIKSLLKIKQTDQENIIFQDSLLGYFKNIFIFLCQERI